MTGTRAPATPVVHPAGARRAALPLVPFRALGLPAAPADMASRHRVARHPASGPPGRLIILGQVIIVIIHCGLLGRRSGGRQPKVIGYTVDVVHHRR